MKAVTEINSKNSINRVTKGAYLDEIGRASCRERV